MAILNSNPEILLRKRKNADRKRLEKQEQIRERQILKKTLKKKRTKFIRPETLISNHKSNELERKRIKNLIKNQHNDVVEEKKVDDSEGNQEYKLLFVVRIPNQNTKGLKIPNKVLQILQVLRLTKINTGVFIKSSEKTKNILKLIEPYVLIGSPSLNSIRKLFQQRATIKITTKTDDDEKEEEKIIKLDDNLLVEEKFGDDLGLCCVEDLIFEIFNTSGNFIKITNWLQPFRLNAPINGWGPEAKLARMSNQEFKIEDYL